MKKYRKFCMKKQSSLIEINIILFVILDYMNRQGYHVVLKRNAKGKLILFIDGHRFRHRATDKIKSYYSCNLYDKLGLVRQYFLQFNNLTI